MKRSISTSISTLAASLGLLHGAACSDLDGDPAALGVREQLVDAGADVNGCEASLIPGCQEQGRRLLGAVFDEDRYFSVSTRAVDGDGKSVTLSLVGDASLRATDGAASYGDTDARFVGMRLHAPTGPAGGEIQIASAANAGAVTYFTLQYRAAGSTRWVNPCVEGEAIAVAGHFDTGVVGPNGRHLATDRLSFACRNEGVAEKCLRWGYAPGADPNSPRWKAHQVCTRMARGDYCKDGTTHTLDETYILIRDTYAGFGMPDLDRTVFPGLQMWPPLVGVFHFESAWPEDDDEPAICLSKIRWQGLKLGELDSCSTELPDPRQDVNVAFCDDLTWMGEGNLPGLSEASLFNGSLYTDLRLEQWRRGTQDLVSTVHGYYPGPWSGPGPRPVPVKHPFSADYGDSYVHVQTQGTILRSLPGSILPDEVVDVWGYVNGSGDHVLARAEDLGGSTTGYSADAWEGMLFTAPPASGVPSVTPLYLWSDANTGDLVNSTAALPAPYTLVDLLGYLTVPVE